MRNLLSRIVQLLKPHWAAALGWLLGLGAIAGTGWWLLNPRLVFNYDMENTLWMMSYQGRCWQQTGTFALTLNNVQVCGMPYPLFYGWGFYPVAGWLSLIFGARLAMRVIIFGALAMQYVGIVRLGRKLGLAWEQRHVAAVAMTWAIYPMTNLYNRGDVPEVVALAWMVCALTCFLAAVLREPGDACLYDRWAWGFYYLMAMATHAITGLYGGLILMIGGCAVFITWPFRWKMLGEGLATALACLVIMAPWLYVLHLFLRKLPVGDWQALVSTFSWTFLADKWSDLVPLRLYPVARELWNAKQMGQLDTQISDPLLLEIFIVGLIFIWIEKRPRTERSGRAIYLAGAGAAMAIFSFIGACVPELQQYTHLIFAHAQFPYRLVNYVDLGLLISLLALGTLAQPDTRALRWFSRAGALAVLLLAFAGLVTKLQNGAMTGGDEGTTWSRANPYDVSGPVSCFYGRGDYAVTEGLPVLAKGNDPVVHEIFRTRPGGAVDQIQPQQVNLTQPTLVTTQIEAFPWNALVVDGRRLEPPELGINRDADPDNPAYACRLPAGQHVLSYEFTPSPWLRPLRSLSSLLALLWAGVVAVLAVRDLPWLRRAAAGTDPAP